MVNLKDVLLQSCPNVTRLIWRCKKGATYPDTYITFQRMLRQPAVIADDTVMSETDTFLVRIVTKHNYEELLNTTVDNLRAAGYGVTSVDAEIYEEETGYWIVPITAEITKENIK